MLLSWASKSLYMGNRCKFSVFCQRYEIGFVLHCEEVGMPVCWVFFFFY